MKNSLLLCLFMSLTINVFGQKETESENRKRKADARRDKEDLRQSTGINKY